LGRVERLRSKTKAPAPLTPAERGRLGGLKAGKNMTDEQTHDRASKAAEGRWGPIRKAKAAERMRLLAYLDAQSTTAKGFVADIKASLGLE